MAAQADYFDRLKGSGTESGRPQSPAPVQDQAARSAVAKKNLRAYKPTMVSNSVNKTALHPGGVE